MTKYISQETVVRGMRILRELELRRSGRTAIVGYLLLKAKQAELAGQTVEIASTGSASVEPQLSRFFRLAPGSLVPDVNPFGSHNGGIEFLAPGYERRGTYTHLYPGRNLSDLVEVTKPGRSFAVRVPRTAASKVREALGRKIPLMPAVAFLLRKEPLDDAAGPTEIRQVFQRLFDLEDTELAELFEDVPFLLEFAAHPVAENLEFLPPDLQPRGIASSHSSSARVSKTLVPLVEAGGSVLVNDREARRIERAFQTSKAIALAGPPGTGKSAMLAQILAGAASDPSGLGMKNAPSYLVVTADADWTSRTVTGGYYPDENGTLVFREGALLQAIKNNQLLWIDELNRADLDRILGPVMTFLTGQPVDLGLTHLSGGPAAKKMVLVWADEPNSGVREDEEQRVYFAGTDWRLVGTYNNVDRGRVFPMGSALQRRWAIIPIVPVDNELAAAALKKAGVRDAVAQILMTAYNLHRDHLEIGLAPFLDIARYVGSDPEATDGQLSQEERNLLADGYVLLLGQQLSRLDPAVREEFFDGLASIFGPELADELSSY